jgi:hypothetical protein
MASSIDAGPHRPRAGVAGSIAAGWRLVLQAPWIAAGLLIALLLLALPLSTVVPAGGAAADLAVAASEAWHPGWTAECAAEAAADTSTLPHLLVDLAGPARVWTAGEAPASQAGAGVIVLLLGFWLFVSGGVLDRLARGRVVRGPAFFAACGTYWFRFVRLAALAAALYGALVWAFDPESADWSGLALFLLSATLVNIVVDFAKVRMVVEDRRSVVSALAAGFRFVRRRWWPVAVLYASNGLVLAALVGAAGWLARLGADLSGPASVGALAAAVVLRLWARLAFLASEIAFFQQNLAHAGYTAAPTPMWPDSPAEEAIRNLRRLQVRNLL